MKKFLLILISLLVLTLGVTVVGCPEASDDDDSALADDDDSAVADDDDSAGDDDDDDDSAE